MKDYKRMTKIIDGIVIDACGNCENVRNPQGCTEHKCYEIMKNRLAELEDKIEQGTLVGLPCKAGDTLYKVVNDKRVKHPIECKVVGLWICIRTEDSNIHLAKYTDGVFEYSFSVPFSEIGKTIFLTKADAEAKLAQLQNKGDIK